MDNQDKKNQNAPSSDSTSALFVSSRKKQLEEQEAQRIAAEKESQRLAAEEEVRRLEAEVEQRKVQAQQEAERIEQETETRKKEADRAAKEAEKIAKEAEKAAEKAAKKAAMPQMPTNVNLPQIDSNPVLQKLLANKKLLFGGIAVILFLILMLLPSNTEIEDLAGNWYSADGTTAFSFSDSEEGYAMSDYLGIVVAGEYKTSGNTVTLMDGDDEFVDFEYNEEDDEMEEHLYIPDFDAYFFRTGGITKQTDRVAITHDDIEGYWYGNDESTVLYFEYGLYEFSDGQNSLAYDQYELYGNTINLYQGNEVRNIVYFFEDGSLYLDGFGISFYRG